MGTVMIRCPRTDQAVSTQIDTEISVFERLPEVVSRLRCPACGEEHAWSASDAWLADAPLTPAESPDGVPRPAEQPAKPR